MLDTVDILSNIKKITAIGQSTRDKQISISVSDVWNGWDLLVAKYDLIEIINVLNNFAKDDDLKLIITNILKFVEQGAANLENTMASAHKMEPSNGKQTQSTGLTGMAGVTLSTHGTSHIKPKEIKGSKKSLLIARWL